MSDAIVATVEPHALAPVVPESKMQILGDVIAPGLSPAQLDVFAVACNRTRLDPFAKQIYAISRWDSELGRNKMTIQTGIDGFRIIAERTGKYGGRMPFEWCGPDGVWVDVWLKKEPPAAARARIIRKDWSEPIYAIARYSAYAQLKKDGSPTHMWKKMDAEQLAKCAEALGLRTAFPQELSGLYTEDEMDQLGNDEPVRAAPKSQPEQKQERKSTPPPATSNAEPAFSRKFPDRKWAGKPLASANGEILSDYAAWVESLQKDPKATEDMRRIYQRALDDTAAAVDALIASEAAKAAPTDPIIEGLEAEVAKRDEAVNGQGEMAEGWK